MNADDVKISPTIHKIKEQETRQMFQPIDGDKSVDEAVEVESLCVNCGKNGTTKLLFTVIPFYKEVILSSFSCPHCSYSNNEIQSAGEIQPKGVKYKVLVSEPQDLNRKIVKSDFASVSIPQLDFEIPSKSQKGEVTTIEGILQRIIDGLKQDQPQRLKDHYEDYEKIGAFITKLENLIGLTEHFNLIIRDSSGRSFVCPPSNYSPGQADKNLTETHFSRTVEEDHELGIYPEIKTVPGDDKPEETEDLNDEIHTFGINCSSCRAPCETKMKIVQIPFFKEVIIMATDCDSCGNKTNEIKSGGGIEDKGTRIVLTVEQVDDLSRDILKAETCSIEIPILELQVGAGTLGGKFTTLEGILNDIKDQIIDSHSTFFGDSEPEMKSKVEEFSAKFDRCIALEEKFTIIFDDPAGNSYVQNIQAPDDDPQLEVSHYERSFEQNEELGLNDINTENYTSEPLN